MSTSERDLQSLRRSVRILQSFVLAVCLIGVMAAVQDPDPGSGFAGVRSEVVTQPREPIPGHGWAGPRPEDMVTFTFNHLGSLQVATVLGVDNDRGFVLTGLIATQHGPVLSNSAHVGIRRQIRGRHDDLFNLPAGELHPSKGLTFVIPKRTELKIWNSGSQGESLTVFGYYF